MKPYVTEKVINDILDTKYTLPDGKMTAVIVDSKLTPGNFDCLLCSIKDLTPHNLVGHASGKRHNNRVALVDIDTSSERSEHSLPQQKDERPKLQEKIDKIRDKSMVGLEFILDVQSRSNLEYHCVLCGDTIFRIRHVIDHLTSHRHRLNYLLTLFPKVFDEVSYLIDLVCDGIEDRFGRSKFRTLEKNDFLENEKKLTEMMLNSNRINNTVGCLELIQRMTQNPDSDHSNKLEAFRLQMTAAKDELMAAYQPYITNPCSYPGYYNLWVQFWLTRYNGRRNDQLKSFDWQLEWSSEWRKIMNEKIKIDVEAKCAEIKNNLSIKDDSLSDIDKRKVQPPQVVFDNVGTTSRPSQPSNQSLSPERSQYRNRSPPPHRPCEKPNSLEQTTLLSGNPPLRLEHLIEKHKHSDDFMISWRELLNIFEIEDNSSNSNAEEAKRESPQLLIEPSDSVELRPDHMELSFEAAQPVSVISVLSVLTALEDILGSLGPKLIQLLQTAIAMDKSKSGSSNYLLDDSHNCILFETIQEKLKGLLAADLIAANLQMVVTKAISDMTDLVEQSIKRKENICVQPPSMPSYNVEKTLIRSEAVTGVEPLHRPETDTFVEPVLSRTETHTFVEPVLSRTETHTFVEPVLPPAEKESDNDPVNEDGLTLKDSEIKILMTKFGNLSEKDKWNFTTYFNQLKVSDPDRVARLTNDVSEIQTADQKTYFDWEKEMYSPTETFYSDAAETQPPAPSNVTKTSKYAYRVAEKNAGVKIKRRKRDENGMLLMENGLH